MSMSARRVGESVPNRLSKPLSGSCWKAPSKGHLSKARTPLSTPKPSRTVLHAARRAKEAFWRKSIWSRPTHASTEHLGVHARASHTPQWPV